MRFTTRERQFIALMKVWFFLFSAGVLVTTVAAWIEPGMELYRAEPLLVFAWFGQTVLFLSVWYLLNGIRDNELATGVLWWYKVLSGTTMLLMLASRGTHTGGRLAVIGGGLLDFVMGAATLWLWLRARRSRYQREPLDEYARHTPDEDPSGVPARRQRLAITVSGLLCAIVSLALFIALMWLDVEKSSTFMIASGNGVAVFGALGFAGMMAADAPRRRASELDILLAGLLLGCIGLMFWALRFPMPSPVRVAYFAGSAALGISAVVTWLLGVAALRTQRPSRFFGAWRHQIFERFAEVLLRGNVELISAREITDKADAWLADLPSRRKLSIRMVLAVIELTPLLRGRLPLSKMGRDERAEFFVTRFRFGTLHDLVKIRALVMLIYYSNERGREQVGFVEFPNRKRAVSDSSAPLPLDSPRIELPRAGEDHVSTDVCIIGSGAGGAVLAARLAEQGMKVVIVEEGPYLQRSRISSDLMTMQSAAYRDGGLLTNGDFDLSLLQGRCVGGSTFLNNGICLEVPEHILRDWDRLGCALPRDELRASFQRVRADLDPLLRLGERPDLVEKGSTHFVRGCEALGKNAGWFDANLGTCVGCGFCTTGCFLGRKMSMDRSFIPRACRAGALLYPDTLALTIEHAGSRARSVRCRTNDGRTFTVDADRVVVSCGALHSSLLLQRSGVIKNVGTRVSFNLGSWVYGEFREPVDSFDGVQMCAFHADRRLMIETMAMPPGAFAASMPGWFEDHFDNMLRYRYFAISGAMIGSMPVGRVKQSRLPYVGELLSPLNFKLPVSDLRRLRKGIKEASRIWLAAGAIRVVPATTSGIEFSHPAQLDRLDDIIIEAEDVAFGSSHPQGGNPMSDDPELGAVDTGFHVHGFDNLYVVDASVFPTALGINPQLTIMAMADLASRRILYERR